MAYQTTLTNDEGEILGIETHYDDGDDGDYIDWYEDLDRFADFDDDEPDTTQDGFPHETDLGNEWDVA